MRIVVLADAAQKEELTRQNFPQTDVIWIDNEGLFLQHRDADAFLDLEFINTAERKAVLQQLLPKPVIVNSVTDVLNVVHPAFVRVNGWSTFLSSVVVEASCADPARKQKAEALFAVFQKQVEWLPDEPGFATARIVSMIVNEAFLALAEGVSTQEEINTAMRLGTAYPFGPFEWAEKIGVQNIVTLLQALSKKNIRYRPAELLVQETNKAI